MTQASDSTLTTGVFPHQVSCTTPKPFSWKPSLTLVCWGYLFPLSGTTNSAQRTPTLSSPSCAVVVFQREGSACSLSLGGIPSYPDKHIQPLADLPRTPSLLKLQHAQEISLHLTLDFQGRWIAGKWQSQVLHTRYQGL